MSKIESAGPQVQTVKKSYKFFDENFDLQTKEVSIPFTPAGTYEEAVQRLGSDATKLLKAVNAQLKREALGDAKKAVKASGISSKAVMTFLRPYREIEPYKSMDRKDQNNALFAEVKKNAFLMQAIKAMSAQESDDDEEEEGE